MSRAPEGLPYAELLRHSPVTPEEAPRLLFLAGIRVLLDDSQQEVVSPAAGGWTGLREKHFGGLCSTIEHSSCARSSSKSGTLIAHLVLITASQGRHRYAHFAGEKTTEG